MMPAVRLTVALRKEYQEPFDSVEYTPDNIAATRSARRLMDKHRLYDEVGEKCSVPWYFVGLVHQMESGGNFSRHLHNGDPLTARTTHVPAGRPRAGEPPFEWAESAADALRDRRFGEGHDIPQLLWRIERYNGWGYRRYHPETLSPYLWGGSSHYQGGKYGSDGVWRPTLRSKQLGAAVIFRRCMELFPEVQRLVSQDPEAWSAGPLPAPDDLEKSSWRYAPRDYSLSAAVLQESLNRLDGIYVQVDGRAGLKTSDAFKTVAGHLLEGDPRAAKT